MYFGAVVYRNSDLQVSYFTCVFVVGVGAEDVFSIVPFNIWSWY
jgi:hypothetical protein